MSTLVTFFSAEGTTKRVAEEFAKETGADLLEIVPDPPYTAADIKWTNPLARCNREKIGKKDIAISGRISDWAAYDTVYLGFPIWYYAAPNIITSFCRNHDWSGKKIYFFATSGGSGIGKAAQKLEPFVKGGKIVDARRVTGAAQLSDWKPA